MTQIHVIKTANHLLQYCVTISWWNCFANDLLKLQALKIRTLYSFYHYQQKTWAQLCLNPPKSLVTSQAQLPFQVCPFPFLHTHHEWRRRKKKFDSHQWTWTRSSLGITMREQWCIGNHSTTLGSLENTAESQNTIFHLSKQNKKANNLRLGNVFLPTKLWFREKR